MRNKIIKEAAQRAAIVFEKEGWTWGLTGAQYVPDTVDLYMTLSDLLEDVTRGDLLSARTGRLVVRRERDDEGNTEGFNLLLEIGLIEAGP